MRQSSPDKFILEAKLISDRNMKKAGKTLLAYPSARTDRASDIRAKNIRITPAQLTDFTLAVARASNRATAPAAKFLLQLGAKLINSSMCFTYDRDTHAAHTKKIIDAFQKIINTTPEPADQARIEGQMAAVLESGGKLYSEVLQKRQLRSSRRKETKIATSPLGALPHAGPFFAQAATAIITHNMRVTVH